jgi:hypothetical protein
MLEMLSLVSHALLTPPQNVYIHSKLCFRSFSVKYDGCCNTLAQGPGLSAPCPYSVLFFPSSEYSYVLKMEAPDSSITLVTMYHIAEDNKSGFHGNESLGSVKSAKFLA